MTARVTDAVNHHRAEPPDDRRACHQAGGHEDDLDTAADAETTASEPQSLLVAPDAAAPADCSEDHHLQA